MGRREDDITAPPSPTSPLSQDTPPHPWTPPAHFGQEGAASRSGVTVEVAPPGSEAASANRQGGPPWMDKRYGRHHWHGSPVLGPVLMIAAGVVFLLNNLGVLPWSIWGQLWRLWPLVLVAIGLDMLFGRRSALLSLVIAVGVLGAGAGVLYYTGGFASARILSLPLSISLPAGAPAADVTIKLDGANLNLGNVDDKSSQLVSGALEYYEREGEPIHDVSLGDRLTALKLERRATDNFPTFGFGSDSSPRWDVLLTRQIPLTLILAVGDGNSTLDLTNLRATHLDLHGKDGNITVYVPANAGSVTSKIELDDGNIDIIVPKGVGVRIKVEKGNGNVDADSQFIKEGDTYTSKDYANLKNKMDLSIKMDDGNLQIKPFIGIR